MVEDRQHVIVSGEIQLLAIFDVADEIDLAHLERLLRQSDQLRGARQVGRLSLERQPDAVAFANPPVTARLDDRRVEIQGRSHEVGTRLRFYDFGALAVQWSIAIDAGLSLADLVGLSASLESPEIRAQLSGQMAHDVDLAVAAVAAALDTPTVERSVEYFTVYVVHAFERECTAQELMDAKVVAQLVVGENSALSQQLHDEIRAASFSYSTTDLVVISYDQAFIYDPASAADISALLEFALAQVLELGYYDTQLDRRLAELSQAVRGPARHARRWGLGRSRFETLRREVLVEHVELVQVLEQVTAAVKVTDDLHYARIYRAAMRVFRSGELIEATNRKLELVFRTYTMLADEVDSHVAHRLEWIIIALIGFEIVLGLTRHL